jgi:pimeloyl-ACP methyl ester carboxylesterase
MHRRHILKSTAALTGAALMGRVARAEAAPASASAAAPAHGPYIATRDGQQLFYKDWGSGPPVVLLGAWGLPSDMWDYQMVPLSQQGLRCVTYDRRGHGRSSHPGGGYDYDTLADDLAAVLDALDLRGVTLVGMSFATGEMVRYLTRHSARRIARMIFVGTAATPFRLQTADNPSGVPAAAVDAVGKALLRDYPAWMDRNGPPFFVPETSQPMRDWVQDLMFRTSMKALVDCSRSMMTTDFRAELPKVAVPTLLVHGDKDVSAPVEVTGRPTAALMPKARLEVYPGAPHGLFLTHMERLTNDILAFAKS